MKAVIFKGPKQVAIEERPVPKIQDPTDIIVKVGYTALCGRYDLFSISLSLNI
jgi:threonine dehydrogenase-like Zn-dependent dehydrogenase